MISLLLPLPVLALVLAALDSLAARWASPWRPASTALFVHAHLLWLALGLLALLPARFTLRFLDRHSRPWPAPGYDARPWIVMLGWMVTPALIAAVMDPYVSLVGFTGLFRLEPWLEAVAVLTATGLLLVLLGRILGGVSGVRSATVGTLAALVLGFLVPARAGSAPRTAVVGRPNLLLLVWDTCRADRLEPYGYGRKTSPGLAALSAEAIVFEDSLSSSTFTFTSHLSMLTGVHPTTHGAHLQDLRFDPARAESIAEGLRAAGYRTGAFVGTDVLGGHTGIRRGFEVYDDRVDPAVCATLAWGLVHDLQALAAELVPALRFDGRPHWFQDFQRPADEVLQHALAWIRRDDGRPWFCFVNLYDVHWPYLPEGAGRELVRAYEGPVDGFLFRSNAYDPERRLEPADKQHVSDLYEGEILDLDAQVTGFLAALDLTRGGTAVLVTSDHGEGLGEQDTWNHSDVREPQVRVPLILRLPEPAPNARRVSAPVSGVDVAPTLLALAGIEPPTGTEGRDLLAGELPLERERWVDDRDHVDPAQHRFALYRGGFKLVRFGSGSDPRYELYDLVADPAGFTDVGSSNPELRAELIVRMEERLVSAKPIEVERDSSEGAHALEALGYAGD